MENSTYVLASRRGLLSWAPVIFPGVVGALFVTSALASHSLSLGLAGVAFLAVAALMAWFRAQATARETITATLLDDRLDLTYRGRPRSVRWSDVLAVREEGDILRFETGDGDGVGMVVDPAWPRRAEFAEDIAAHLDASRGYQHRICDFDEPGEPDGHACTNPLGCAGQAGCQGHATA